MTALSNVALSDIFTTWMIRTNQLVVKTNEMESIDASMSTQANNANFRAIGAFSQANVANIQSVAAFAQANTVNLQSIGAFTQANLANFRAVGAYVTANAAFGKANTASLQSIGAFDQANSATNQASIVSLQSVGAFVTANAAFAKANIANSTADAGFGQANLANIRAMSAFANANVAGVIASAAFNKANTGTLGLATLWVPTIAMFGGLNQPPAAGQVQLALDWVNLRTLDFDAVTSEYAYFSIRMPKSWNEGTVTAKFTWSHAATASNFGVVWGLQGYAFSDTDGGNVTYGAAQFATDTGGVTDTVYISPTTAAITIGGAPAAEDWVSFRVHRSGADGNDTLAIDARLHGITIYFTTDAATDD